MNHNLEFKEVWQLGDPMAIEAKFRELLHEVQGLPDKTAYLRILSHIALAQALQNDFDGAQKTLDAAEAALTPTYNGDRARILLERGIFKYQAGELEAATTLFETGYTFSLEQGIPLAAAEAARLLATITTDPDKKAVWEQRADDLEKEAGNIKA